MSALWHLLFDQVKLWPDRLTVHEKKLFCVKYSERFFYRILSGVQVLPRFSEHSLQNLENFDKNNKVWVLFFDITTRSTYRKKMKQTRTYPYRSPSRVKSRTNGNNGNKNNKSNFFLLFIAINDKFYSKFNHCTFIIFNLFT